jgi:hypothetical protein
MCITPSRYLCICELRFIFHEFTAIIIIDSFFKIKCINTITSDNAVEKIVLEKPPDLLEYCFPLAIGTENYL